jgi:uncharacterized membrane protein
MSAVPSTGGAPGADQSRSSCDTVPLERLRRVPLFRALSAGAGEKLCRLLAARDFDPGTRLFNAGDAGDAMYFIDRGRVHISVTDADGQSVTLAELGDGDFFGEMALVDGHPRSAGARVVEPTRMAVLTRDNFLAFIKSDQQIMMAMLEAMAGRLRRTDNLLRHRIARNANVEAAAKTTAAERAADLIAEFGGSWKFIGVALLLFVAWMAFNTYVLATRAFDPYPYIFLNLVLAMITGLQAPIIMMSQNRQTSKDRLRADLDYEVNLKNELLLTEIRTMLYDKERKEREASARAQV